MECPGNLDLSLNCYIITEQWHRHPLSLLRIVNKQLCIHTVIEGMRGLHLIYIYSVHKCLVRDKTNLKSVQENGLGGTSQTLIPTEARRPAWFAQ